MNISHCCYYISRTVGRRIHRSGNRSIGDIQGSLEVDSLLADKMATAGLRQSSYCLNMRRRSMSQVPPQLQRFVCAFAWMWQVAFRRIRGGRTARALVGPRVSGFCLSFRRKEKRTLLFNERKKTFGDTAAIKESIAWYGYYGCCLGSNICSIGRPLEGPRCFPPRRMISPADWASNRIIEQHRQIKPRSLLQILTT